MKDSQHFRPMRSSVLHQDGADDRAPASSQEPWASPLLGECLMGPLGSLSAAGGAESRQVSSRHRIWRG